MKIYAALKWWTTSDNIEVDIEGRGTYHLNVRPDGYGDDVTDVEILSVTGDLSEADEAGVLSELESLIYREGREAHS